MNHRSKDRAKRELIEASELLGMGGCLGSMDENRAPTHVGRYLWRHLPPRGLSKGPIKLDSV